MFLAHHTKNAFQPFQQLPPVAASLTSIAWPQSTLNFAIPYNASLSTAHACLGSPSKTHLLHCQKMSVSVTALYLQPCPLN